MKKEVICGDKRNSYGFLGESTGVMDLKVGDVIAYTECNQSHVRIGIVLEDTEEAKRGHGKFYAILGFFYTSLENWVGEISRKITKVVPAELVTVDILNSIIGNHYVKEIREVETVKLTLEEIEAKLGYPIELV